MGTKLTAYGEVVVQNVRVTEVAATTKVAVVSGLLVEQVGTKESPKELFSYFDFEFWDKAADYIGNNVKKGDTLIVLDAVPRQNRWENSQGEKMYKIIFRVKSFRVIPKKEEASV